MPGLRAPLPAQASGSAAATAPTAPAGAGTGRQRPRPEPSVTEPPGALSPGAAWPGRRGCLEWGRRRELAAQQTWVEGLGVGVGPEPWCRQPV